MQHGGWLQWAVGGSASSPMPASTSLSPSPPPPAAEAAAPAPPPPPLRRPSFFDVKTIHSLGKGPKLTYISTAAARPLHSAQRARTLYAVDGDYQRKARLLDAPSLPSAVTTGARRLNRSTPRGSRRSRVKISKKKIRI